MKKILYVITAISLLATTLLVSRTHALVIDNVELIEQGGGYKVIYESSEDIYDGMFINFEGFGFKPTTNQLTIKLEVFSVKERVYSEEIKMDSLVSNTSVITQIDFEMTSDNKIMFDFDFSDGDEITEYVKTPVGSYYKLTLFGLSKGDTTPPNIAGRNFATDVDNPKPLSYFLQYVTATDETDGDVTASLNVVNDLYTPNMHKIGRHQVMLKYSDKAGNIAATSIFINVLDSTSPVITGSTAIVKVGYKETFNISAFKTTLSVSDNYDANLTASNISILTDNYTNNRNKIGIYTVLFTISDSSGNESTFTKQIEVIDNVAPIISGTKNIITSNTSILTETDIRKEISANDDIDGNITSKIEIAEDNYTGKGNKVGKYTIIYSVTDKAGNIATHTIEIERKDNLPPVIMIKEGVSIWVDPDVALTKEQIVQLLTATGQLNITAQTQVLFTYNEYLGNEKNAGEYAVRLLARSTDGNESVHNLKINVLSKNDGNDTVDVTPKDYFEKYKNYIYGALALIIIIGIVKVSKKKKH